MVHEHAGGYDLALAGFTVNVCAVDLAFTLHFLRPLNITPQQEAARLRIEGAFAYTADGTTSLLEPGPDPTALCPALGLLWRTVESAAVDAKGVLELTFSGQARLRVPPDPRFEAWTLNAPGNVLIVSGPGGAVTTFGA